MEWKELEEHLLEIKVGQASMDGKINEICRNTKSLAKRVEKVEDKADRGLSWKSFTWFVTILISVLLSAFIYTNNVDQELHQHTGKVHYYQIYEEAP